MFAPRLVLRAAGAAAAAAAVRYRVWFLTPALAWPAACARARAAGAGEPYGRMPDNMTDHKITVTKTIITSPHIYKPVGPYSQAVLANNTLYVSGVLGMNKQAQFVSGGVEAETRQALDNLRHVLEAGGASLDSVLKTTILLSNMEDFQIVNEVYGEYFPENAPARATYQVARLPRNAAVEIEAIALVGNLVIESSCPSHL